MLGSFHDAPPQEEAAPDGWQWWSGRGSEPSAPQSCGTPEPYWVPESATRQSYIGSPKANQSRCAPWLESFDGPTGQAGRDAPAHRKPLLRILHFRPYGIGPAQAAIEHGRSKRALRRCWWSRVTRAPLLPPTRRTRAVLTRRPPRL